MTNLAKDTVRVYEGGGDPVPNHVPVAAATQIFQGSAVGQATGSRNAKVLAQSDAAFLGFALRGADNSGGAAGDVEVVVASEGIVELVVAGVDATTVHGTPVYASDGNTFDLTATGDVGIGRIHRVVQDGVAMVAFQASSLRSLDTSEV